MRLSFFCRAVESRPYDRLPSDTWYHGELRYSLFVLAVFLTFSCLFLCGWNFYFPTFTEQLLWRICSVYHAVFSFYGAGYYIVEWRKVVINRRQAEQNVATQLQQEVTAEPLTSKISGDLEAQGSQQSLHPGTTEKDQSDDKSLRRMLSRQLQRKLSRFHDRFASQNPGDKIPLRTLFPVTVLCFLYVCCRLYLYFEDLFSLREQPADVYDTVNKFIPFLGGI